MGNCVPVRKSQDSASKFRCSSYSRTECILIQTHIQENSEGSLIPHAVSFPELSDEEDLHFRSGPWEESDGEDFLSVNNDLTPSRTNTPIHKSSEIEVEQLDEPFSTFNCNAEPPEADVKKLLFELFNESFNADESDHQHLNNGTESESSVSDLPRNSGTISPYDSVANLDFGGETVRNTNSIIRTGKAAQFAQCYLPKLMQIIKFTERK